MSMFSYGMLEVNCPAGRQLPVDGGFDDEGNLTKEPGVIEKNRRILPMGYWKGSGLSIVLDMIATLLSNGSSVAEVTRKTAMNMVFRRFSSPLRSISSSTVRPAMPSCSGLWISSPAPNGPMKTWPSVYRDMNLPACWKRIVATASPLMTASGRKFRRCKEIYHDLWPYRAAQSVSVACGN